VQQPATLRSDGLRAESATQASPGQSEPRERRPGNQASNHLQRCKRDTTRPDAEHCSASDLRWVNDPQKMINSDRVGSPVYPQSSGAPRTGRVPPSVSPSCRELRAPHPINSPRLGWGKHLQAGNGKPDGADAESKKTTKSCKENERD